MGNKVFIKDNQIRINMMSGMTYEGYELKEGRKFIYLIKFEGVSDYVMQFTTKEERDKKLDDLDKIFVIQNLEV